MEANNSICCDILTSVRKLCPDCKKINGCERTARHRQKIKDLTKQTRSVERNKRSIYFEVLCDKCLDKHISEYCFECSDNYKKAKATKYCREKKRRKLDLENLPSNANKAINSTSSQTNQTDCGANVSSGSSRGVNGGSDGITVDSVAGKKSTYAKTKKSKKNTSYAINGTNFQSNNTGSGGDGNCSGNGISDGSGIESGIVGSGVNSFSDTKKSKYAHLFCTECENKSVKEICLQCKKNYDCAKSNKSYARTKLNMSDQTQQGQMNRSNQSDPIRPDYSGRGNTPLRILNTQHIFPQNNSK